MYYTKKRDICLLPDLFLTRYIKIFTSYTLSIIWHHLCKILISTAFFMRDIWPNLNILFLKWIPLTRYLFAR